MSVQPGPSGTKFMNLILSKATKNTMNQLLLKLRSLIRLRSYYPDDIPMFDLHMFPIPHAS